MYDIEPKLKLAPLVAYTRMVTPHQRIRSLIEKFWNEKELFYFQNIQLLLPRIPPKQPQPTRRALAAPLCITDTRGT